MKIGTYNLKSVAILALSLVIGLSLLLPAKQALAFTPSYNPNNLIDNPTFLNNQTMSAAVIQVFLSNVGSGLASYTDTEACDATIAPYYTHCGQTITAAQIIYDASQAYGINPRAILATLEKEQSLVTDPTPTAAQLNCAMGYNSCSNYVGFFTQVDNGTWALRYNYEGALGDATWLSWYPGANYPCKNASSLYSTGLYPGNSVTFADPGGTAETVTLSNAATASLYCYTPYVGPYSLTGYSGSYNFVYYYQLWFGSTQATVAYAWNLQSTAAYEDSMQTTPLTDTSGDAPGGNNITYTVAPGADIYVQVVGRNVGYTTWSQTNLHLGTSNPNDRDSIFYNNSWLSVSRPAGLVQSTVPPGGTGTFNFSMQAPSQAGSYNEYFNLVADGVTWLNDPGLYFTINVVPPVSATNTQNTGLNPGQTLTTNQNLLSPDTESTLNLQGDGNLVLYGDYLPVWATNSAGTNASNLVMQTDGNLVLYTSGGAAVWASNTSGNPGAYLRLQTDGNLVVYSSTGTALWSSGTVSVPNHLSRVNTFLEAQKLYVGQSLETANRDYQLILQADSNLVLYYEGTALWSSGTVGKSAAYLAMQTDGNLVLYNTSGNAIWASNTAGKGLSSLIMQADGNLVIYNANWQPTWASNTRAAQ